MMNPYTFVDNALLGCANFGVRAWNFASGWTKCDLANVLVFSSAGANVLSRKNPLEYGALLLSGAIVGGAFIAYHINERVRDNTGRKTTDPVISMINPVYGVAGLMSLLAGTGFILADKYQLPLDGLEKFDPSMLGMGTLLWGASMYITRAKDVTPGKNIISRSLAYKKDDGKSGGGPITPAFMSFYLSGLESRV